MHVCWISTTLLLTWFTISQYYLQVATMNAEFHVLGQPYKLVDVQEEINSVAGRAVDDHSKQQLDNHACSLGCHWKQKIQFWIMKKYYLSIIENII